MAIDDPVTLKELRKHGKICNVILDDEGQGLDNAELKDNLSNMCNVSSIHVLGKNKDEVIEISPVFVRFDEHVVISRLKFRRCCRVKEDCGE